MSILEYNGAAIIGMVGKNCVGIASDTRLGIQGQTVATDFQKVFQLHDKLFVGLAGLGTDVQTMSETLEFRLNLYKMREERDIKPSTCGALVSHMLYERRFAPWFVEPIVVGLEGEEDTPYIYATDLIGAGVEAKEDGFVVSGTCADNMYGMCESLFKPDLEPDDLFETLSQCLVSSFDRDAMSGWGGVVHILTKDGTTTKHLKARQD
mmetsp:Transcript_42505/g.118267  ORF Transcript_42505/g.118267 Transcript_42505/m.118267 type:complete len:208 (+) Transcript_42505:88-711(+)